MQRLTLPAERWPWGAREVTPAPSGLYLWGQLPPAPWVALVGTRHPTQASLRYAFELARRLAKAGVAIASGGALGIDSAAHRGALAGGGRTVVVAPCCYERPYPEANGELFAEVLARDGGYLSHEPEAVARRHAFFARNQLLVACSALVVLVEAPLRSGSGNAALWARRLGRPLWVVPHAPWNGKGRGCLNELRRGGQVLISYRDVLGALLQQGWPQLWPDSQHSPRSRRRLTPAQCGQSLAQTRALQVQPGPSRQIALWDQPLNAGANLSATQVQLLRVLSTGPQHLDELLAASATALTVLTEQLTALLLAGCVLQRRDGRYELVPPAQAR